MILVDTDVLIGLALREEHVLDLLQEMTGSDQVATTSISLAEFLRGIAPSQLAGAHARIDGLQEVPFGPRAARRFGTLMHDLDRKGARLDVADGMIAAIALEQGARLLTGNTKHFRRVPGLELVALPS